jgi:hypothetical protein
MLSLAIPIIVGDWLKGLERSVVKVTTGGSLSGGGVGTGVAVGEDEVVDELLLEEVEELFDEEELAVEVGEVVEVEVGVGVEPGGEVGATPVVVKVLSPEVALLFIASTLITRK